MSVRQGPVDLAIADLRRLVIASGADLRETRAALGLSQSTVARAAGISAAQLSRIERCEVRDPSLAGICRVGRVLGLAASLKLYPAGSPIRDAGQLALIARFEPHLGGGLRQRREVGLPAAGELRTWDGVIEGTTGLASMDAETRIGDAQALSRRLAAKLRDDPRSRLLVLVVARTVHNRAVLAEHREAFRELLPLDGPAIAHASRLGRLPPASGIIVL